MSQGTLKLKRSGFVLLMAVTSAVEVYASALITLYLPSMLALATIPFISAISTAAIVYLSTEEKST